MIGRDRTIKSSTQSFSSTLAMIFGGLFAIAFPAFIIYFPLQDALLIRQELVSYGMVVPVLKINGHWGAGGNPSSWVYEFVAPGSASVVSGQTTNVLWVSPHTPQNVIYSSRDPSISLLESEYQLQQGLFGFLLLNFGNPIGDLAIVGGVVLGMILLVTGIIKLPSAILLERNGSLATGVIEYLVEENANWRTWFTKGYYVIYRFQENSIPYYLKQKIHADWYNLLEGGENITVKYLRQKPFIARITDWEN